MSSARIALGDDAKSITHTAKDGSDPRTVQCARIIGNAAPAALEPLMQADAAEQLSQSYARQAPSASLFALTLGLSKPPREFGIAAYSTQLLPPWMKRLTDYAQGAALMAEEPGERMPPMSVVDYAAINSGVPAPPYVLSILGPDLLSNWDASDVARGPPVRVDGGAGRAQVDQRDLVAVEPAGGEEVADDDLDPAAVADVQFGHSHRRLRPDRLPGRVEVRVVVRPATAIVMYASTAPVVGFSVPRPGRELGPSVVNVPPMNSRPPASAMSRSTTPFIGGNSKPGTSAPVVVSSSAMPLNFVPLTLLNAPPTYTVFGLGPAVAR